MTDLLTELDRWWPVLGILATVFYGWGIYHLSRRFATREEYRAVRTEQENISGRLGKLEKRMETVPDANMMHAIELSLTELRGDVKEIRGRMDGMETSISGMKNQINILVQHHLENSRV